VEDVPPPTSMRFSAAALPEADRLAIWREEFGRKFVHLDIAPLQDDPLRYDASFQLLDTASAGLGTMSAVRCERSRRMIADCNDDILMLVPLTGRLQVDQAGQEATLGPGDALVRRSDDPGCTWSEAGHFLTLSLPQAVLGAKLADADRLRMTVLPGGSGALQLLVGYARLLFEAPGGADPALGRLARDHLLDLAAMAIGANRDAWVLAQEGGARAAHLAAIDASIARGHRDPGFGMAQVSRALGLSPGHIRKLLAARGASLSDLVMAARLASVRADLTDPRRAGVPVSQLAYAAGFNDISYFNRAFRRRYDCTPTDMRARSRGA